MLNEYKTTIGLEVHVELNTKSKIFCSCSTSFAAAPNENTCPICLGMPGTLPLLNQEVVEDALSLGLATHCDITRVTTFDRKNYFYPDNPQNYQISQLYAPIATKGFVEIKVEEKRKKIRINEMHMEEDAGKLIHDEKRALTKVDYNRSGVPLIEIVSEPDLKNAAEAVAYVEALRDIIRYLKVSDCKLEEGQMRVDVNLSVAKKGDELLGVRTEMKNLSSFKAVRKAIENESKRQIALLEAGEKVIRETRRWDENLETSVSLRSKEEVMDYRYFKEPDLPALYIKEEWIKQKKKELPELRNEKVIRFMKEYNLPEYDSSLLTEDLFLANLFEETAKKAQEPKLVSNYLMGEGMRLLKEKGIEIQEIKGTPQNLAALINLITAGEINNKVAKEVFEQTFLDNVEPISYIQEKGLKSISDEKLIREMVLEVIKENEKSVEDYKGGKERAFGFLVGQTMKALKGKGNPQIVNAMLKELLK
ncbi:MAG TPA: Asp-tRNA(Asn)/Glu-tRNA(Gln) amidotransferase subunit GatB [Candidatus Dorea intestinavium]|nr:Asp-tRNA(Asn)/Glu-tRNA(Gln) amidotransferase subunit GatB [Candidatus Dorea intestinavium]